MKVLIDNGHGVNTAGKRSPDGVLMEYAYARRVADSVVNGLRKRGVDAERIVKEEVDVPLSERVRRVNDVCKEFGAKHVLLLSVHCNASGDGSSWMDARGWSAYTSRGSTKSDRVADCLYDEADRLFAGMKVRRDLGDGDSDFEADFYILKHTRCAAVLTENFFMDNREDVDFLLSADGFSRVVDVHVCGIMNYLSGVL